MTCSRCRAHWQWKKQQMPLWALNLPKIFRKPALFHALSTLLSCMMGGLAVYYVVLPIVYYVVYILGLIVAVLPRFTVFLLAWKLLKSCFSQSGSFSLGCGAVGMTTLLFSFEPFNRVMTAAMSWLTSWISGLPWTFAVWICGAVQAILGWMFSAAFSILLSLPSVVSLLFKWLGYLAIPVVAVCVIGWATHTRKQPRVPIPDSGWNLQQRGASPAVRTAQAQQIDNARKAQNREAKKWKKKGNFAVRCGGGRGGKF